MTRACTLGAWCGTTSTRRRVTWEQQCSTWCKYSPAVQPVRWAHACKHSPCMVKSTDMHWLPCTWHVPGTCGIRWRLNFQPCRRLCCQPHSNNGKTVIRRPTAHSYPADRTCPPARPWLINHVGTLTVMAQKLEARRMSQHAPLASNVVFISHTDTQGRARTPTYTGTAKYLRFV